jgi:hypothetical protein
VVGGKFLLVSGGTIDGRNGVLVDIHEAPKDNMEQFPRRGCAVLGNLQSGP